MIAASDFARGTDVGGLYIERIVAHHTPPREAGMVFAQTRPKLAAYTHLVFLASEKISAPTIEDLVSETRQTYDGPLQVGEDLMRSRSEQT